MHCTTSKRIKENPDKMSSESGIAKLEEIIMRKIKETRHAEGNKM